MIVVDTNLLAYLLLPIPHAAQADAILLKDPEWIAPTLIHSELRNVLVGAVRRKDIKADDARVLLDRAAETHHARRPEDTAQLLHGWGCLLLGKR